MRIRRSRMGIRPAKVPFRVIFFMYFWCFVLMSGALLLYVEETLQPNYEQLAESMARKVAAEAISSALLTDLAEHTQPDPLIQVITDHDGRVTAAQVNPLEIARIQSMVTRDVQDGLNRVPVQELSMPVGLAFHNTLMSELGPKVDVRLVPIGNAVSNIETEYKQSGINQTLNVLYLNVTAQVRMVAPFISRVINVSTKVPLAYILLVGQVPTYFYNSSGKEFIPPGMVPQGAAPKLPQISQMPQDQVQQP